jgi:hypothetical protein
MESLFDNTVHSDDRTYNYIRGHYGEEAKVAKKFTESLWMKYHPYADRNFGEQSPTTLLLQTGVIHVNMNLKKEPFYSACNRMGSYKKR